MRDAKTYGEETVGCAIHLPPDNIGYVSPHSAGGFSSDWRSRFSDGVRLHHGVDGGIEPFNLDRVIAGLFSRTDRMIGDQMVDLQSHLIPAFWAC